MYLFSTEGGGYLSDLEHQRGDWGEEGVIFYQVGMVFSSFTPERVSQHRGQSRLRSSQAPVWTGQEYAERERGPEEGDNWAGNVVSLASALRSLSWPVELWPTPPQPGVWWLHKP